MSVRFPLVLPCFLLIVSCFGTLRAQVEVNPYAGLLLSIDDLSLSQDGSAPLTYTGKGYTLGADVFIGGRQLALLTGLAFYSKRYTRSGSDGLSDDAFIVPLGLAYRLRHPDTSFNLVVSAAGTAGKREGGDGVSFGARGGLTAYFDMVSIGVNYYRGLSDTPSGRWEADNLALTLGGRF